MRSAAAGIAALALVLVLCIPARAERIVLAPGGLVANANTASVEYLTRVSETRDWMGFVTVGVPPPDLGVEVEAERYELGGRRGTSLSAQYSLTGNAFSDIVPAISVGVRDVLDEGPEGRAVFLAMTKTMGLSLAQSRFAQDLKVHLGVGSSHMDGLYAGATVKLTFGPTVSVEYYRQSGNASISVPVTRYGAVRLYSLDGHIFAGGRVGIRW